MDPTPDAEEHILLLKLFDPAFYLAQNDDVRDSKTNPFLHFMEHGAFEGRSPHPLFDTAFYLAHHPELTQSRMNPLLHFLRIGAPAGDNPHPLFDTVYYLSQCPDLADSGLNPLIHFIEHGGMEGRNPHPSFSSAEYLAANEDVKASRINPLIHYICYGADEGRAIYAPASRDGRAFNHRVTNLRQESLRRKQTIERMHRHTHGQLLACPDPLYQDRLFYCLDGKRRRILPDHLECYGLSLDNLRTVAGHELRRYQLAGPVPLPWPEEAWTDPIRSCPLDLHEISTSRLRGSGIEFSAGMKPMPVPLCCEVKYADLQPHTAPELDPVPVTCAMGMEDMSAIPDSSLDFVIACQVIEHLRNPLRAFEQVHRKLKPGGQYVLVVPDMRLMFDRDRTLTTLEHLVADFEDPTAERDLQHYYEFFSQIYDFKDDELDKQVRDAITQNRDLHFHTWTYESFAQIVQHTSWTSVWSQPPIWEDPASQEFFFVLSK